MKTFLRSLAIRVLCPAHYVLSLALFVLSTILFVAKPLRKDREMPFALVLTWRPWFAKRWRYSTTLGFTIFMHPRHLEEQGDDGRTLKHERVHVRQYVDDGILALLLSLPTFFVSWKLALVLLACAPLFRVSGFLGALLRGGHVYRDAEHERGAYGQTDIITPDDVGQSWLDGHLEAPREW